MRGVPQVVWIAIDAVGRACLEQQDRPGRLFAETAGKHGAGRASPTITTSARPARPLPISDMALDLLGSITRDRIVASAWMIGHRQIQVIEFADGRLEIAARKLRARLDVELAERLAEVVLHGAGADE